MRARRALLVLVVALSVLAAWLGLRSPARGAREERAPAAAAAAPAPAPVELALPPVPPPDEEPAAEARVAVEPAAEEAGARPFDELADDEGLLQVRVLALETGQPLGGARLRLETPAGEVLAAERGRGSRGGERLSLVTDRAGRADYRVHAGVEYVLHAQYDAPLGRSVKQTVRPLEGGQLRTVVLQVFGAADEVWCARVVDAATGAPLAAARVALLKAGPARAPARLFEAKSAPDGRVRIELSSKVSNRVLVEAPGYGSLTVAVEPGHGLPEQAQELELERAAALDVRVVDAAGAPLPDVAVRLNFVVGPRASGVFELALGADARAALPGATDADGRVVFDELPARTAFVLQALGGQRTLREQDFPAGLEPGRRELVNWALGTGCAVHGRVLDPAGAPLPRLSLALWSGQPGTPFEVNRQKAPFAVGESDDEGRFRFEDVAAGDWHLGPQVAQRGYFVDSNGALAYFELESESDVDPGLRPAPVPLAFTLGGGEVERELVLTVWRGLYIRGRIEARAGEAMAGTIVIAQGAGLRLIACSIEDGRFEVGPLAPGEYELSTPGEEWRLRGVQAGAEGVVLGEGGGR